MRTKHSAARPEAVDLADDVLQAVVAGLKHGEWEWDLVKVDAVASGVLRTLFTDAINAYVKTVELAFGGYPDLAVRQLRRYAECTAAAWYILHNRSEATRWLQPGDGQPAPDFAFLVGTHPEPTAARPRTDAEFALNLIHRWPQEFRWQPIGTTANNGPGARLGPTHDPKALDVLLFSLFAVSHLLLEGVIAPFGAVPARSVFALRDRLSTWCRDYLQRGGRAYLARTGASSTELAELQSGDKWDVPLHDRIRLMAMGADLALGGTASTS